MLINSEKFVYINLLIKYSGANKTIFRSLCWYKEKQNVDDHEKKPYSDNFEKIQLFQIYAVHISTVFSKLSKRIFRE